MLVHIYSLNDPETGRIRYVGQTIQPLFRRLDQHMRDNRRCHLTNWISLLEQKELVPAIEVIVSVPEGQADTTEQLLISYFRSIGYPLTNISGGGQSNRLVSRETREKLSKTFTGRRTGPPSAETRAKIGAAHRGRPSPLRGRVLSEEQKEKVAASKRGKKRGPQTPEWKEKIAAANRGRKHTPEAIARMRAAQKGHKSWNKGRSWSPEVKEKIGAGNRGKTLSEEHRAKLSEAHLGKSNGPTSEATRAKISEGLKRYHERRRNATASRQDEGSAV